MIPVSPPAESTTPTRWIPRRNIRWRASKMSSSSPTTCRGAFMTVPTVMLRGSSPRATTLLRRSRSVTIPAGSPPSHTTTLEMFLSQHGSGHLHQEVVRGTGDHLFAAKILHRKEKDIFFLCHRQILQGKKEPSADEFVSGKTVYQKLHSRLVADLFGCILCLGEAMFRMLPVTTSIRLSSTGCWGAWSIEVKRAFLISTRLILRGYFLFTASCPQEEGRSRRR